MPKKYFFAPSLFIVLCFFVTSLLMAEKSSSETPPNIIILMVDTLRADYLGCYGFQGDVSPHIDRFANESLLFSQCVSPAPWTKPAIASLFTSLYPQTHHVTDHLGMHWKKVSSKVKSSVLSNQAVTLAEVLSGAGYDTNGFVGNDFLIRRFGFGQGFKRYFEPTPHSDVFSATPLMNKAIRLVKKGKIKEPFFLYLHFMDVHAPYQCGETDFKALSGSPSFGKDILLSRSQRRKIPKELGEKISWKKSSQSRHVKNWRNCYASGIRKFDRRFGAFMKKLEKMDILDNTIIILTSDHGEELYDHKGWAHSHTLYSELLDVPLVVRMPKGKNGGKIINKVVSLMDVMPTLIHQANVPWVVKGMEGRDLSPLLSGGSLKATKNAYGTATRHDPGMISVQGRRYKLIWNFPTGEPRLFDLFLDPQEWRDISKKKPKVAQIFIKDVIRQVQDLEEKGTLTKSAITLSRDLEEKLKSLGYLQ